MRHLCHLATPDECLATVITTQPLRSCCDFASVITIPPLRSYCGKTKLSWHHYIKVDPCEIWTYQKFLPTSFIISYSAMALTVDLPCLQFGFRLVHIAVTTFKSSINFHLGVKCIRQNMGDTLLSLYYLCSVNV